MFRRKCLQNIPIVKRILKNSKRGEFATFCNVIQDKIFIIKKATEKEIKNFQIYYQNYSTYEYRGKIAEICINQINNLFTKKTNHEEDVENFEKNDHLKHVAEYIDNLDIGEAATDDFITKLSCNLYKGKTFYTEPGFVIRNKIMMYRIKGECEFLRNNVENYLSEKFKIKIGNFTENFIRNQYTHFIFHDDIHHIYYFIVVRKKTKISRHYLII